MEGSKQPISLGFAAYCRNATDNQLENILQKEYEASRHTPHRRLDYHAAVTVAEERGWVVNKGQRLG